MDDLERRIRAARPVSGHRNLPLSDRAKRELSELVLAGPAHSAPQQQTRPRWQVGGLLAIAVALVLVAVIVPISQPAPSANAVTPPPLEWTAIDLSMDEVVEEATRALEAGPGPSEPIREAHSVGWYYQVEIVDDRADRTVISPQVNYFRWEEDLSAYGLTLAGTPYWADDETLAEPGDGPRPGDVLWEEWLEPGEYGPLLPDVPGTTREEIEEFLAPRLNGHFSPAFELVIAIKTAFSEWTLTNTQHALLLSLIIDTPGFTVMGESIDRADRPVIGLSVTNPNGPQEERLLLSRETGRIIGFETFTTEEDRYFPGEAVISYRMHETGTP